MKNTIFYTTPTAHHNHTLYLSATTHCNPAGTQLRKNFTFRAPELVSDKENNPATAPSVCLTDACCTSPNCVWPIEQDEEPTSPLSQNLTNRLSSLRAHNGSTPRFPKNS
jgi:hypothetical protein